MGAGMTGKKEVVWRGVRVGMTGKKEVVWRGVRVGVAEVGAGVTGDGAASVTERERRGMSEVG